MAASWELHADDMLACPLHGLQDSMASKREPLSLVNLVEHLPVTLPAPPPRGMDLAARSCMASGGTSTTYRLQEGA